MGFLACYITNSLKPAKTKAGVANTNDDPVAGADAILSSPPRRRKGGSSASLSIASSHATPCKGRRSKRVRTAVLKKVDHKKRYKLDRECLVDKFADGCLSLKNVAIDRKKEIEDERMLKCLWTCLICTLISLEDMNQTEFY